MMNNNGKTKQNKTDMNILNIHYTYIDKQKKKRKFGFIYLFYMNNALKWNPNEIIKRKMSANLN